MKKLLTTLAIGTALMSGAAMAENFEFNATIDIVETLKVKEARQMDFGVIERPASDVKVHITKNSVVGNGNTATHLDTSTIASGLYKISGSALKSISIAAKDAGNVAGMSFASLDGSYNGGIEKDILTSPLTGQAAPTLTGKDLVLGGVLNVSPTVQEGTYEPAFVLDVNYE